MKSKMRMPRFNVGFPTVGRGLVAGLSAWFRLILLGCFGYGAGLAIGVNPALTAGVAIGAGVATEIASTLLGVVIDTQYVVAWMYALMRSDFGGKLGDDCPFCGGTLPDSRSDAQDHIADCSGTTDSLDLAYIQHLLPESTARDILADMDREVEAYPSLLEYAEFMMDGHQPVAQMEVQ